MNIREQLLDEEARRLLAYWQSKGVMQIDVHFPEGRTMNAIDAYHEVRKIEIPPLDLPHPHCKSSMKLDFPS